MKKLLFTLHVIAAIMFAVLALSMGSCDLITEEIEVEKIIRDTVTIEKEKFVDRYFTGTDTVEIIVTQEVPLLTVEHDTVFVTDTLYVVDSVFVVQYIDRVEIQHVYHDTLYIFPGRGAYSTGIYEDIVQRFALDAAAYGRTLMGGNLIIAPWEQYEAPPATRSAFAYYHWDQQIIKLRDDISHDEAFTPLYRELARWQMGLAYDTKDPDAIMNPDFNWRKLKFSDSDEKKKPYLDKLFGQINL